MVKVVSSVRLLPPPSTNWTDQLDLSEAGVLTSAIAVI